MTGARTAPDGVAGAIARLAAIALGLAAGAMLAEGAVLVPYWRSLPAESFLAWYTDNASLLLDFYGPLEIVSAALAILAAALYAYRRRPGRGLLALSALLAVAILASFPIYFRDVNASFAAQTIPVGRVADELARWAKWHWVRTIIGVAAFVAATVGAGKQKSSAREDRSSWP